MEYEINCVNKILHDSNRLLSYNDIRRIYRSRFYKISIHGKIRKALSVLYITGKIERKLIGNTYKYYVKENIKKQVLNREKYEQNKSKEIQEVTLDLVRELRRNGFYYESVALHENWKKLIEKEKKQILLEIGKRNKLIKHILFQGILSKRLYKKIPDLPENIKTYQDEYFLGLIEHGRNRKYV